MDQYKKIGSDAEDYIFKNGIEDFLENLENFDLEFETHMKFLIEKTEKSKMFKNIKLYK